MAEKEWRALRVPALVYIDDGSGAPPLETRVYFSQYTSGRIEISRIDAKTTDRHPLDIELLRRFEFGQLVAAVNGEGRDRFLADQDLARRDHSLLPTASDIPAPRLRFAGAHDRAKPPQFYQRVADSYTALTARGSRRPAATIAEANDVPVSTAHRWIKEARTRGLIAPGRRGRSG